MKVFILLTLFALSVSCSLGQPWTQLTSGTTNTINDIFFVNKNVGWFVSHYGLIRKTTDGGLSWVTQTSGYEFELKQVQFLNGNLGYILAASGVILKTTNGGADWVSSSLGYTGQFYGMDFISSSVGWVVGSEGKILKTTDGGSTWINQSPIINETFFGIDFIDENIGNAVGTGGKIYRSYLGGSDWFPQNSGVVSPTLFKVFLQNSSLGLIVGSGLLLRTTNGGSSWLNPIGWPSFATDMSFLNKDSVWIASSGGTIFNTTNGGQSFTPHYPLGQQNYTSIFFLDMSNGWVGGSNGILVKYAPPKQLTLTAPNGGENWTVGSSQNITWTQSGVSYVKLEYTTNNGTSWNMIVASTNASSGSYSWTVPNVLSTNCKIRIVDTANDLISDDSDSTFIISRIFEEVISVEFPGLHHSSSAWGDYDNDGDLDVLIVGGTATNISRIYRNNGDGTFTYQTTIQLAGTASGSVDWGDFNNDGFLDIVICGFNSNSTGWFTKIYKNIAGNTFEEVAQNQFQSCHNGSCRWGDFDSDGDLDILITGGGGTEEYFTKIYRNDGNEIFSEVNSSQLTGVNYGSGEWGDYDNDGDLDILITGYSPEGIISKIYRNIDDSTFSFQSQIAFPGVWNGQGVWGDFNNDSFLDFILTGATSDGQLIAKIFKNNRDNTFIEQASGVLEGVIISSIQSGDFDNDGNSDIAIIGRNSSETPITKIYLNSGNGTFYDVPTSIINVCAGSVAVADYNNDGSTDILVSGENNSVTYTKLYKNISPVVNTPPNSPVNLNSTINGRNIELSWDKSTDDHTPQAGLSYNLALGNTPGNYNIIAPMSDINSGRRRIAELGNSRINSFRVKNLIPGTYYWTVQAIDGSYLGSQFGQEQSFTIFNEFSEDSLTIIDGLQNGSIDWGDFDNDNDLDLIFTGSKNLVTKTSIYENLGNGIFQLISTPYLPNLWTGSAKWFDYNNDSYLDIILIGQDGDPGVSQSKLFQNMGDGTFADATPLSFTALNSTGRNAPAIGDFNNDGFADIYMSGLDNLNSDVKKLLVNLKNGEFNEIVLDNINPTFNGATLFADIDNDMDLDLIITGSTSTGQSTKIFKNSGNGNYFDTIPIELYGYGASSCSVGDFDSDSFLDLAISGMNSNQSTHLCHIYKNYGGNSFSLVDSIFLEGVAAGSTEWGDFDNNGDLDLLITGWHTSLGSFSKLLRNNGNGNFDVVESTDFLNIRAGSAIWGDYDNDNDIDVILSGLTNDNTVLTKMYKNQSQTPNSAPSSPQNLVSNYHSNAVSFGWDKSLDDHTNQNSLSYNITIGTQPGKCDIVSPLSDRSSGYHRVANPGKIRSNAWYIKDLPPGTYYWSVQAIDGAFIGSQFSPEQSFTIPEPTGNYSLYFDGINDYIGNMIEDKIVGATPFTIEMWAKIENPSPFNNIGLINKGVNTGSAWSYNFLLHNTLSLGINSSIGAAYVDGGLPTSGVWHHIAGSRSGDGTLRLFLDGQKIGEHLVQIHDLQSPNALRIGRNIEDVIGSYFKGYITRIRLSKIDRYINNFVPVQQYTLDSNTVALWNFSTGSDTLLLDESDNQIHGTIHGATWSTEFPQVLINVNLTSPNGGENLPVASTHNITWTQSNVSHVKIEYSTNNGSSWTQIASSTPAAAGSYSWTVPNTPSTTCKVRLTDVSNNQISDESNGSFTILPQSTGNYSLYFDGVNDYIGNIFENKLLGASPFTLELWVKNQSSNVAPLINRGSNSGVDWSYNLYVHDSLYFGVNAPLKYVGAGSPSLNSWHHVAAVKSSDGFLKLYIDGSKVSESYYGTGNLTSNFSLQFGKYFADGSSDYFKGYLTRIRISKTARYIEDFNPTLTFVLDTNTAGLWNFSENSGTLLTDVSGNSFHGTIHGATWSSDFPQISGNITVTSPNGGEYWVVGATQKITWTQSGISDVKITYSTDNGNNWYTVVNSVPASIGSYAWTIPNTTSVTCKVRITDISNSFVADQSDSSFIIGSKIITVLSPNGGENWQVGSTQKIMWTQANVQYVSIDYTTNNGVNWHQITSSTLASTGNYYWNIPNRIAAQCKVKITDINDYLVNDQSNSVFTISAAPVFSVQVTSPNGGERWFAETQYSITWNSANVEDLKLEYTSDGGASWTQIAGSVAANLGSYIWTVPNTPSSDCKVRLTSVANPGVTDESDAVFTIAEAPKVTLTSPNGGETWMVGRQYSITWTAASVNKLRGEYSTDGGTMWILIADTISANLGSYIWTMPNTESGNCLVRLSGIDQTSAGDQSDAPFTIELERSLTITAPVPGETYTSGRILEIKWSKLNVDLVDLLYSTDDGVYWQYIADSISSASQSYNWLIPELNSNQVRIRAVASQKQDLRSDLNGNITILPSPKISLVSNLSAAYLKTGSNYHIEWLLENVPAVNVLFSSDGGSVWNQIAGNLMPSVRSFNWVVPDLNSKNCRVKIEATNNSSLFSSNELTFTIYSYSQVVTVSNVWQFGDIRDVGNYRLISLPGSVTGDLGSIMSGKFTTDWNAYWDNGSDVDYQIQYNGGPQFNLQPGKGFWVLSKDPISLSKQTEAVTIDSTLLYHVPLHKGWNIIGNVFTKSINWSDIRFVNGLPQSSLLYYWDGKWDFPSVMEPYKGYYFFNPDNRSSLKIIYPVEASLAKTGEENPVSGKENGIVLSFGGNEILATFDPVSSTGLDTNDYFLPGVNFCRKRIAFTREDNGITRQLFIDSQPLDSLGNKFRFSILNETSTPDDLKLNLKIEQKNLNIYLLDEKYSEFIDLRVKNSFKLSPQKGSRYYTLMIGDDSFIRTMKSQYLPTEYLLYQNFPNPFNPETSIKYALPADGYIKLKMYDILGNEVLTLFEGEESAGVHTRAFNLSGFASGVYFYRLETSGTNLLKKMILMK